MDKKKEIIDKVLKEQSIVRYRPYLEKVMSASMEEYADLIKRNEAIEFAEWLNSVGISLTGSFRINSEKIYNQFLESKQKKDK